MCNKSDGIQAWLKRHFPERYMEEFNVSRKSIITTFLECLCGDGIWSHRCGRGVGLTTLLAGCAFWATETVQCHGVVIVCSGSKSADKLNQLLAAMWQELRGHRSAQPPVKACSIYNLKGIYFFARLKKIGNGAAEVELSRPDMVVCDSVATQAEARSEVAARKLTGLLMCDAAGLGEIGSPQRMVAYWGEESGQKHCPAEAFERHRGVLRFGQGEHT